MLKQLRSDTPVAQGTTSGLTPLFYPITCVVSVEPKQPARCGHATRSCHATGECDQAAQTCEQSHARSPRLSPHAARDGAQGQPLATVRSRNHVGSWHFLDNSGFVSMLSLLSSFNNPRISY